MSVLGLAKMEVEALVSERIESRERVGSTAR